MKVHGPTFQAGSSPAKLGSHARPVILVVDDDDCCRALIREYLTLIGYRVLLACSGEAAVAVCARRHIRIDATVTDVLMPGMSGLALSDRIEELRPGLPIMLVSGSADPEDPELKRRLGAGRMFLPKPFYLDALSAGLAGLCGRRFPAAA